MSRIDPAGLLLAIDTATTQAVLALGTRDGRLVAAEAWDVGHRHAEELLGRLDALLESAGLRRADAARLAAIAVGTGPGAFTGLRVGLATAKALARAFGRPVIGLPSGGVLLEAAAIGAPSVLLLPAGPADAYLVTPDGAATFVPGGEPDFPPGTILVAVDLGGRAPSAALARGERARDAFPGALVRHAAERLATGATDDPALLVPEYVTLPRGPLAPGTAEVAWSPARR